MWVKEWVYVGGASVGGCGGVCGCMWGEGVGACGGEGVGACGGGCGCMWVVSVWMHVGGMSVWAHVGNVWVLTLHTQYFRIHG